MRSIAKVLIALTAVSAFACAGIALTGTPVTRRASRSGAIRQGGPAMPARGAEAGRDRGRAGAAARRA